MHRLAFLLAPLFAAACADDARATDPIQPPPDDGEPDEPPPDDEPPPAVCVTAAFGAIQVGTAARDDLRDVVVMPNGAIVVAGFEDGSTNSATGEVIGSRGIVLEYAHDLASMTKRAHLATGGTDSFDALVRDPSSGTVWLAARTTGALPGLETRGSFDYALGRLDATGFTALARGRDGTPEHPKQLALGGAGTLAVVGHEQRVVADGATWTNPFIDTFTARGAELAPAWFATRRAATTERYTAVDIGDDSVIVGGAIDDGEQPGMIVIARSHDADLRWERRLSINGLDRIAAVKVRADGNVLWAGTTAEALGDDVSRGGTDIVVGLLDGATGKSMWTAQHGTAANDRAVDLALDAQGRIYIAGDVETARGDVDTVLTVLDARGGLLAEELWTSDGNDVPNALTVDACGAVVIVGNTDGDLAGLPQGGRDGFVLVTRLAE